MCSAVRFVALYHYAIWAVLDLDVFHNFGLDWCSPKHEFPLFWPFGQILKCCANFSLFLPNKFLCLKWLIFYNSITCVCAGTRACNVCKFFFHHYLWCVWLLDFAGDFGWFKYNHAIWVVLWTLLSLKTKFTFAIFILALPIGTFAYKRQKLKRYFSNSILLFENICIWVLASSNLEVEVLK